MTRVERVLKKSVEALKALYQTSAQLVQELTRLHIPDQHIVIDMDLYVPITKDNSAGCLEKFFATTDTVTYEKKLEAIAALNAKYRAEEAVKFCQVDACRYLLSLQKEMCELVMQQLNMLKSTKMSDLSALDYGRVISARAKAGTLANQLVRSHQVLAPVLVGLNLPFLLNMIPSSISGNVEPIPPSDENDENEDEGEDLILDEEEGWGEGDGGDEDDARVI